MGDASGQCEPNPHDLAAAVPQLTPDERTQLDALLALWETLPWRPLPGAQRMAYDSAADILGYGGAAGGGKTDLACGLALTRHRKAMILRRIGTELSAVVDRFEALLGGREGYNGSDRIWRTKRHDGAKLQIEFGAAPNLGDERKWQGRPHDLLVFDEAANFLEPQVRFLLGWLRSVDPAQRCRALLCFNPPTTAEGRWIVDFFGPWIDRRHPLYPTPPGELRWAAMVPDGHGGAKDVWVDGSGAPLDGRPFVLAPGAGGLVPVYDFDPAEHAPEDVIQPRSRSFVPARVRDNPHLMGTGYMSTLQALPEPLRSQMLRGDFSAGIEDDPWQVIPTAWIEAAMARWQRPAVLAPMDSLGVDVARGGKDRTVIARRHGNWFDRTLTYPGSVTPDGFAVRALVIGALRDQAPIHIDVIGVGSSPYDLLREARQQVVGVNVAEKSAATDRSGRLGFLNLRSELWWKFREWLDPAANTGAALPDEPELLAELAAPKWGLRGTVIAVEGREEIVARVGRSVDLASAYVLGRIETGKIGVVLAGMRGPRGAAVRRGEYDPYG